MTSSRRKPTIREEVDASIDATRAALDRLTPDQFKQVRSQVKDDLGEWWREELMRVRERRLAQASPYVVRAEIVARMARALWSLAEFEGLDHLIYRYNAYMKAGFGLAEIREHDAAALASERMRRRIRGNDSNDNR